MMILYLVYSLKQLSTASTSTLKACKDNGSDKAKATTGNPQGKYPYPASDNSF